VVVVLVVAEEAAGVEVEEGDQQVNPTKSLTLVTSHPHRAVNLLLRTPEAKSRPQKMPAKQRTETFLRQATTL
jgi:hypothetical protein